MSSTLTPRPSLPSFVPTDPRSASATRRLALADSKDGGPALSAFTLGRWLAVLQGYLGWALNVNLLPTLKAIGLHSVTSFPTA